MRFAVVGAGSIGGYLGALLSAAGEEVTFIARGANLEAIKARGMKVVLEDKREVTTKGAAACATPREAGVHDVVFLTLKAHQVAAVAPELHRLCNDQTGIVTMQNGIPWWYFQRHGGEHEGTPVRASDPDGSIARHVDPARIVGCVVYPAATLVEPGVVRVQEGRRFTLGELDGATTPRVQAIADALEHAGFKAPVTTDIRAEIWLKVWGNLSFNPISALAHSTLVDLCQHPLARDLARNMMLEAQVVATKLGRTLRVTVDRRIEGAERVGKHKTSMLQDVEAGRDPEIDALVGSVIELGRLTHTPTPHISSVYACVKLLSQTMAMEKAAVRVSPLAPPTAM